MVGRIWALVQVIDGFSLFTLDTGKSSITLTTLSSYAYPCFAPLLFLSLTIFPKIVFYHFGYSSSPHFLNKPCLHEVDLV
jgi:hypothetical protein